MNVIDMMREKRFLGQEFLTWMWYRSEVDGGLFELKNVGAVEIWFEERMVLDDGYGELKQEVTCKGKLLDLAEARTALREGKKATQVRLRILAEGREWKLTVKAEGLELAAVRAPKTLDPGEEEAESMAGRLLDRTAVMKELVNIIDALYARFLAIRFKPAWDEEERPRIARWLKKNLA